MLRLNLSEWAIRHRTLMFFFMLVLAAAGIFSYAKLGQSEDPDFTFKLMVVKAYLPGATLSETQRQLTDPIEKTIQEVPELDYTKSFTKPGETTVFVRLLTGAPRPKVPDIWYQVRKKMGDLKATLPSETVGPFCDDEFGDTYGLIYAVCPDGFSHREAKDWAEEIKSSLSLLRDVAKVDIIGEQTEKIYVEFSSRRLAQLGVSTTAIAQAIAGRNKLTPPGSIDTGSERIAIEASGRFLRPEDVANVEIWASGQKLRVGDVASIVRTTSDPPEALFRYNGRPAIALGIVMREGGNMTDLGRVVSSRMDEIVRQLPAGLQVHLVANQPDVVLEASHEFTKSLAEAVAIVMVLSFITLGLRAGTVVAFSIPFVLALVFIAMHNLGIDLHRISLGSLIISLGLLVDDAMITVESMVGRLERGWALAKAATFAYTSTAIPMLTGTLVTICGFMPVGLAHSEAGEYCYSIFEIVGLALIFSWFVAVLFAPVIGMTVLKAPESEGDRTPQMGRIKRAFARCLDWTMRHAWTTVVATLALFAASFTLLPHIPQQFFPPSSRPELIVDLALRQSASIQKADATVKKLEAALSQRQDVAHWSSYVGRGAVRFYMPLDEQLPNDAFAQVVVIAKTLAQRNQLKADLTKLLDEEFPEAYSRVATLEMGPPCGWPVSYRVYAPDPRMAEKYARRVADAMAAVPGLRSVNFNWADPGRKLVVRVRAQDADRVGLTPSAIAQTVYSAYSGVTVTQAREGIHLVDVVMRAIRSEREDPQGLASLDIPLPAGGTAPLSALADIEYTQDWPLVWRRNRQPSITVQADTVPGAYAEVISKDLRPAIERIRAGLPERCSIEEGGMIEESAKAQNATFSTMPMMAILMLVVLMVQLQSFRNLFLVLSVAPLGLIGVVVSMYLAGQNLGYVALLGILALVGMIVRNSVILVHQIEIECSEGASRWEAVRNASLLRARPIMLTAVAAILGMVPIAGTQFWGPMAFAIMGGLTAATLLTLLSLPAAYLLVYRIHETEPAQDNKKTR